MDDSDKRSDTASDLIRLGADHPVWDRFFQVAPLIIVGTKEEDGGYDLAPKHLAMPMGWENFFGFVCTPDHGTYANVRREGAFTVSFPKPSQVVVASLAAAPRCEDGSQPSLAVLDTFPASEVDGVLVTDAHLHLECESYRIYDDFGPNSLITGRVVEAHVSEAAIRRSDRDDEQAVFEAPLLTYISPGRYAEISHTFAFPFHAGSSR